MRRLSRSFHLGLPWTCCISRSILQKEDFNGFNGREAYSIEYRAEHVRSKAASQGPSLAASGTARRRTLFQ
jgi:hypothetical protein